MKTMNILDKQCLSFAQTFGGIGGQVPKREKYSWAKPCLPGKFKMIHKTDLNIDGSYQREEVSKAKVLEIARDWDWKLFGTLSVIMRENATFWVYDGGHRCRAAFFRDDITTLPCMVFEVENEKTEAKAFLGANTMKTAVSAFHKHRASVKTGEPTAVAAQSIIEKNGYFLTHKSARKYGFSAINTLRNQVKEDAELAEMVFAACAMIAQDGEPISGDVLEAVFTCQKKLEGKADILKHGYLERMKRETIPGIEAAIRREKHIAGKGGNAISAKALLDVLNKGKQRRITFA